MIYQNYKKFMKNNNNENTISQKEKNNEENPIVQNEINEDFNNESNIIKGLLNNMNDDENNMELEKDNEDDKDKDNKINNDEDDDKKMENEEEKMDNNEEDKIESNIDDKTKFKTFLINLLKNNNFLQQRAVKMTITNFLELLNLFNNNGIHFN